jgi:hypothetical protein
MADEKTEAATIAAVRPELVVRASTAAPVERKQ